MGWKLVLFSSFVTSALVDSFPYPEGNIFGAFQSGVPSDSVYFQPNPIWPQNQVLPPSTPNPVFSWNSNINQQLTDGNSFGRYPSAYAMPQRINSFSMDSIEPAATLQNGYQPQWPNVIPPQQSTPAPLVMNNGFSEVRWKNQRLNRPEQTYFGQLYNTNSFVEGNPGINDQLNSNYQSAGSVTPKSVGFAQAWLPQDQFNIVSTPRPVEVWPKSDIGPPMEAKYLLWPKLDNEKGQSIESKYLPLSTPDNEQGQLIESKYLPLPMPDNEKEQPIGSQYLLWPKLDNGISQPIESKYLPWPKPDSEKDQPIESNSLYKYNTPSLEIKPVNHLGIPPGPLQSNSQQPILRSQKSLKSQRNIPKHYIIVHVNGTYEHVNDLDDIEIDKFNISRIKSKEPPNNIINAIIEVEEASEFDKQMSLQVPYDTEIVKIPRGTDWNSKGFKLLSMSQSHGHPDFTNTTTEDTTYFDMQYFKSEYIMPIQSTTENSIDKSKNSLSQTKITNRYKDTNENNSKVQSTTGNTYMKFTNNTSSPMNFNSVTDKNTESTTDYYIDSTTNSFTQSAVDSVTPRATKSTTAASIYNIDDSINRTIDDSTHSIIGNNANNITDIRFENSQYSYYDSYDESRYNKMQKHLFTKNTTDILRRAQIFNKYHGYKDTDIQNINTNIISREDSRYNSKDEKENDLDGHDTIPLRVHSSDSLTWNLNETGNGPDMPTNNQGPEESSNENDKEIVQTEESASSSTIKSTTDETGAEYENHTEKVQSPVTEEQDKLREDLKIDVSELKTTVKGPVVWFKTNKTLWDNIMKGEQAFDAVSIYDVKCKPKLIERVTKIHYYPNGTEIVDYAEIIWDSPDAENPKEIKSKREIRDSKNSD